MTIEYVNLDLSLCIYVKVLLQFKQTLKIIECLAQLFVWNQHSTQPVLKYCEHTAAVKAIAWSPHLHGLLASGGGTADRCIRFWNTTTNSHLSCMDTGSQVIIIYVFPLSPSVVCVQVLARISSFYYFLLLKV